MKRLTIITALLLTTWLAYSQDSHLTIRLKEKAPVSAYLYLNQGSTLVPVDSILLGKEVFSFNTSKLEPGIYSFVLSEDMFARFIINHENIEVSTSLEALSDSVRIIKSEENKVYYSFLHERQAFNKKNEALTALLDVYPPKSKVAKVLGKEQAALEKSYNNAIRGFINTPGDLLAPQIILSELPTKAPSKLTPDQQRQYLIANWWSNFPFENPYITNTPGIADRLWDYFDLFYVDGISRQEQEQYFRRAIDEVMNQPSISRKVQEFFVKEMTKTLAQSSHDGLIEYIKNNYSDNIPTDFSGEFDKIAETAIGQVAPNFAISTDTLKTELHKLQNKGVAIIFWSMSCSHCQKLLPELNKSYPKLKDKGFEVIAINLDAYKPAWKLDIARNRYQWININIQNPYTDSLAKSYNVTGTPTIFILDSEKKIVEKPHDIKTILKALSSLEKK